MHKKGQEMKLPEGTLGEKLQQNCEGLKVLLVDERPMIGATALSWMEFMCRYGVKNGEHFDQSWGGLLVVIFLGDDVQLSPVLDSPVYNSSCKLPAALQGVLVWKYNKYSVDLKTIVRQGIKEQELRDVLLAIREYQITPVQAKWLQKFPWQNIKSSYGQGFLNDMSEKGLFVFPTHQQVWDHNKIKLLKVSQSYPIVKLSAIRKGVHANYMESDRADGLQKNIFLCKNAKVMLTTNLCVPFGLFNGATGTIIDLIYKNENRPENSLSDVVMVQFDNYSGLPFITMMSDFMYIDNGKIQVKTFIMSNNRQDTNLHPSTCLILSIATWKFAKRNIFTV